MDTDHTPLRRGPGEAPERQRRAPITPVAPFQLSRRQGHNRAPALDSTILANGALLASHQDGLQSESKQGKGDSVRTILAGKVGKSPL